MTRRLYSIKYMYLSLSIYLCIIDTHWPCTWHELGNVECLYYGKDRELFWRNCVNLSEMFSFCHRQQKFGCETEIEQVRGSTQKSRHKWCKTGNQWRHLHQKSYKPSENIPPLAAHISSRLSHVWRAHWYMHRSRYSIELCNDVRFVFERSWTPVNFRPASRSFNLGKKSQLSHGAKLSWCCRVDAPPSLNRVKMCNRICPGCVSFFFFRHSRWHT